MATVERSKTYDADRMAARRASQRNQVIPRPKDPARRIDLEHNSPAWLRFYLPHVFYNPFTADQISLITEAEETLRYGTSKCRAMRRGGGKSSILRYLEMKHALHRSIAFGLLLCATGPKADSGLDSIKAQLRCRRDAPLAQDYPLECSLARYVGAWPSKANNLTMRWEDEDKEVSRSIRMEWSRDQIILPTFADEEDGFGPILKCLGVLSDQLQGCNVYDVRPDWVLLDDLDSRDSLAAADGTIANKLETIIDQNVAGLGGPGKRLGQFMLCTIPSRRSIAFKYSDPTQKPSYSGMRIPSIKIWPERKDLWEQYIAERQDGQVPDAKGVTPDPFGRLSHQLYQDNFEEMNRGAVLSDENDFNKELLPDGTPMHLSALQKCYDYIADKGLTSFQTEHQNDPPEDENVETTSITPRLIASRISSYKQGACPAEDDVVLTAYCDTGKYALHWAITWWRPGAIGGVADYGIVEVHGTGSDSTTQTLNLAILNALLRWRDDLIQKPIRDINGIERKINLAMINSAGADPKAGAWDDAVWEFIRSVGGSPFAASIGIGKQFNAGKSAPDRRVGEHWFATVQPRHRNWLYCLDATHWKRWCHERFLTPTLDENNQRRSGSLALFVPTEARQHHSFTHHICAELWEETFVPGKGLKSGMKMVSKNNHWLDALAGCCAASSLTGISLMPIQLQPKRNIVISAGATRPDGRSWL